MGTDTNLRYDHPSFLVRRTATAPPTLPTNGAIGARFRPYINARLIAAHAIVITQGVAAGNDLELSIVGVATTSIGVFAFGTNAPLISSSITALDQAMGLGDEINITHGTSTEGVALVTYEYELSPGGTFST